MATKDNSATTAPEETDEERELREAEEARLAYEAAQAKVKKRQQDAALKALKPYSDFLAIDSYAKMETEIAKIFSAASASSDRTLYNSATTLQDSLRILRESITQRQSALQGA